MFQVKVVEKIETHILNQKLLFQNRAICEKMWKKNI
jgi:hypothetical protein